MSTDIILTFGVMAYLLSAYVAARIMFFYDEFADDHERPLFLFFGLAWPMLLMVAPLVFLFEKLGVLLIPSKQD